MTIYAATAWKTNAELIVACRDLGYLDEAWLILDPTYGDGTFWNRWLPWKLIAHDLKLDGVDFRKLPHKDNTFGAVVFDPPYKLNGTATPEVDAKYGVEAYLPWQERHQLIREGIDECIRVLEPKGYLLLKCMDQVSSGQVRWQTRIFADYAEHGHLDWYGRMSQPNRVDLVDMLHILGGRAQPFGRRQLHARRNYSTMLIFRKSK
jgi:hypothetical protein